MKIKITPVGKVKEEQVYTVHKVGCKRRYMLMTHDTPEELEKIAEKCKTMSEFLLLWTCSFKKGVQNEN